MNIFDKIKADELSFYKSCDYKLEFEKKKKKFKLFRNRIYLFSKRKLNKIKKKFDENLKKRFIIFNQVFFVFSILFIEKSNKELKFYVDYRKLNQIIKRNRYFIFLIDEVLK